MDAYARPGNLIYKFLLQANHTVNFIHPGSVEKESIKSKTAINLDGIACNCRVNVMRCIGESKGRILLSQVTNALIATMINNSKHSMSVTIDNGDLVAFCDAS